jgi:hypothetical protein
LRPNVLVAVLRLIRDGNGRAHGLRQRTLGGVSVPASVATGFHHHLLCDVGASAGAGSRASARRHTTASSLR